MDFDKEIKKAVNEKIKRHCILCGGALYSGDKKIITIQYIMRGHNVHEVCWTAYKVSMKLKGKELKTFI